MSDINIDKLVGAVTPEIYQRFKLAVELRKWPNGSPLTAQQVDTCLQAIIAYEHRNLPEQERTGYVPPKAQPCADESHIHTHEAPVKWKND